MSTDETTGEQLLDLSFQPPQEPTPEQEEFRRDEERRQEELRQAVLEKLPGNVPMPSIYDVEANESHGVNDSLLSQDGNENREIQVENNDDSVPSELSLSNDQLDNIKSAGNTWQASTPFVGKSEQFDTSKGISFVTPPRAPNFPSNIYHISGDVDNNNSNISELTQNLITGFDHDQTILEQRENISTDVSPHVKELEPEEQEEEYHAEKDKGNSHNSSVNEFAIDTDASTFLEPISDNIVPSESTDPLILSNVNFMIPTAAGINIPLFGDSNVKRQSSGDPPSTKKDDNIKLEENDDYLNRSQTQHEHYTSTARAVKIDQYQEISKTSSNSTTGHDVSPNSSDASVAQLRILYEARGRKVDELSQQLLTFKEDSDRQIRILQHKVLLSQDECQALHSNIQQFQNMISERTIECDELRKKLTLTDDEKKSLRSERDEAISKLHIAECSIEALNQQISEYSRSETILRSREQHDKIVASLKERHQEEVYELKEMHDKTASQLSELYSEKERLESELINVKKRAREAELDHTEAIKKLTQNLHEFQNRYTKVLEEGSVKDVLELRDQLHRSETAKSLGEGLCEDLKKEVTELKDQCKMYEAALRLGVQTSGISPGSLNESLPQNSDASFQWSTKDEDSNVEADDIVDGLRVELDRCLASNAAKRSEIYQLRSELKEAYQDLKNEKEKCSRTELVCASLENRMQQLEIDLKCARDSQVGESNSERILRQQNKQLREDYDDICCKWQEVKHDLASKLNDVSELNRCNSELKESLELTKREAEKDKQESVERCRLMCKHLHETAIDQLKTGMTSAFEDAKEKLVQQHRDEISILVEEIDVLRNELHKAKEAYVRLADEQSLTESRMKEEYQKVADEAISKALEESGTKNIRKDCIDVSILANETSIIGQLPKRENTEEELQRRMAIELAIAKTNWIEDREEKFRKAVESSVSTAKRQWEAELTAVHEVHYQSRLATAKAEIQLRYEKEVDIAVEEAVSKVKKEYEGNFQQRVASAIQESAHETENELKIGYQKSIEDAICKARKEMKEEMESRHKLELEVVLEEVTSSLKAEHRKEIEIAISETALNSREKSKAEFNAMLDDLRSTEIENLKSNLEERYAMKLNSAVENALENAKAEWAEVYEKNTLDRIESAVREEKKKWNDEMLSNQSRLWEEQAAQLKSKWDEMAAAERQKAIEIAITNAEIKWLREKQEAVEAGIKSARDVWMREHKVSVVTAVENAVDTARSEWNQNLTHRLSDIEQRWSVEVEKQKVKEVSDALTKAKSEWKTEFARELQSIVNVEINRSFANWASSNGYAANVVNRIPSSPIDLPHYTPIRQQIQETVTTLLAAISSSWEHDMTRKLHEAIREAISETETSVQKRMSVEFQQKVKATMEQNELKYQHLKEEDLKQFSISKEKAFAELNQLWLQKYEKLNNDNKALVDNAVSSLNKKFALEKAEITKKHTSDMQQLIANQTIKSERDLHNLKIDCERDFLNKLALERKEWEAQNRTIKDKYHSALSKRQQMWEYERENLQQQLASAESIKDYHEKALAAAHIRFETKYKTDIELAAKNYKATKQHYEDKIKDMIEKYAAEIEKLAKDAKKPIVNVAACQTESFSELTASYDKKYIEKLEMLGERYISTMLKIRQDIMRFMTQSRERTAAKMRAGILRERIDVAKRCKVQFTSCVRRLINEEFSNLTKTDISKFIKSVEKAVELSDLYNTGLISTPKIDKDIFSDLKRDMLAFNAVLESENSINFGHLLTTESKDLEANQNGTKSSRNDEEGNHFEEALQLVAPSISAKITAIPVSTGNIIKGKANSLSNISNGDKSLERRSSSTSIVDVHGAKTRDKDVRVNRAHSQADLFVNKAADDDKNTGRSSISKLKRPSGVNSPPLIHGLVTKDFLAKPVPHLASQTSTNRDAKGGKNSKSSNPLKRTRNVWVQSSEMEGDARFGISNTSITAGPSSASKFGTDDNLPLSSPDPDCYSELPSTMSFIKRMRNIHLKD
ncbi:Centrosomal protein of 152 kDa [Trichoplax sp. H2]|nr:Centrosomal protein of 152 kDa [Trichoplax sp. H2]|eukprot:RDD39011.1 Centrosomal protein of 152 kDa [Trichoplax sp. H2]